MIGAKNVLTTGTIGQGRNGGITGTSGVLTSWTGAITVFSDSVLLSLMPETVNTVDGDGVGAASLLGAVINDTISAECAGRVRAELTIENRPLRTVTAIESEDALLPAPSYAIARSV
jgi:hypothetical protein